MAKSLIFLIIVVILFEMCTCRGLAMTEKCTKESDKNENLTQISVRHKRQYPDSAAYYDFIINEGSFKFWAVFQMVTIAILFYSTFAAIYYAKWNYLNKDPDEEDAALFIRRRMNRETIRILRAINTPPA